MNVKPGDLAIYINSGAGNEGAIVEIIGPMGERPIFDGIQWGALGDFMWMVKSPRPLKSNFGISYFICPAQDRFLRPVSGLPDTEQTDQQEPIKELA